MKLLIERYHVFCAFLFKEQVNIIQSTIFNSASTILSWRLWWLCGPWQGTRWTILMMISGKSLFSIQYNQMHYIYFYILFIYFEVWQSTWWFQAKVLNIFRYNIIKCIRGDTEKKKRIFPEFFPKGGGGSLQFPKLFYIYRFIFCMRKHGSFGGVPYSQK